MDRMGSLDPFREVKEYNISRLALQPGYRVLDVGSGPGVDVRTIAAIVGPSGYVLGVDNSEMMVEEARRQAEGTNLPIEYRVMNATALELEDSSFDAARSDRVLQHLDDPAAALAEMVRITCPGGAVAVSDTDWGMAAIDMEDRDLAERFKALIMSRVSASPWIGRKLQRLFVEAGLREIKARGHVIATPRAGPPPGVMERGMEMAQRTGLLTADDVGAIRRTAEARAQADLPMVAIVMFTVSGHKA
jgi:ubiquinone/menaquinone biosynthesis C-methylase UbiE